MPLAGHDANGSDDDDESVDNNAYHNMRCSQDVYMPAVDLDDEAFRNHDDQPTGNTVSQRLTFQQGTIISPGTLPPTSTPSSRSRSDRQQEEA